MTPVTRFFVKCTVLLSIIISAQVIMYVSKGGDKRFLPIEITDYLSAISNKPDVIYFNDSVNTSIANNDKDRSTMSDMLASLVPALSVATIDHAGYNLKVYRSFFRNMLARGARPKVVIVPINMRSFSVGWDKNAGWQFSKLRLLLDHDYFLFRAFFKPLGIFKAFQLNPISQAEFENMPVMDGEIEYGRMRDFLTPRYSEYSEDTMQDKLITTYMYGLTPENGLLQAAIAMSIMATRLNIKIIFYVTPVDVETGDKYLGPRFRERLRSNVAVIKSAVEKGGTIFLDLSETLPNTGFNWRPDNSPNEHLNEHGRMAVAKALVSYIPIENDAKTARLGS